VKEEARVTEDLPPDPISVYNKAKMVAERVLLSYASAMAVQIVRPATVCGFSPRMRLDVSVNMLTMQALTRKRITVFGGAQIRPNIHIQDITDVYLHLLERPHLQGIYNAGFENLSILRIAQDIAARIPADIVVTPSNDPRSYRLNADKLRATGYAPKHTVADTIDEIAALYARGALRDEERWHNLTWMRRQVAA
jgi:nucleoside-diphosphate-sugar epimerase